MEGLLSTGPTPSSLYLTRLQNKCYSIFKLFNLNQYDNVNNLNALNMYYFCPRQLNIAHCIQTIQYILCKQFPFYPILLHRSRNYSKPVIARAIPFIVKRCLCWQLEFAYIQSSLFSMGLSSKLHVTDESPMSASQSSVEDSRSQEENRWVHGHW